jgi:hypothetical protein
MRLLGVAVVLAVVGVVLVSSGVAPTRTIGPAKVNPAPAGDTKPAVASSRPEIQRSALDPDRDRDAALGLIYLLGMFQGRRPVGSP